jgi:hypothetical protein
VQFVFDSPAATSFGSAGMYADLTLLEIEVCSDVLSMSCGGLDVFEMVQVRDTTVHSGPLARTSHVVDAGGPATLYEFADGGEFSFDIQWTGSDGATRSGGFRAPIGAFEFTVPIGVFPGGPSAVFSLPLGIGLFDAPLADELGISRHTTAEEWLWIVDGISGDETSPTRHGALDLQGGRQVQSVPEPGMAALAGIAAVGAMLSRRRRRASIRKPPGRK